MVAVAIVADYRRQKSSKCEQPTIRKHFQTITGINRHKQASADLTGSKMFMRRERPEKHDTDLPRLSFADQSIPRRNIDF
jgi:hypothetical protein